MTKFRPCIDLHSGSVKQIVGSSLSTTTPSSLRTNFVSSHPASYYANLYREHNLTGAHVIMLGPGNEEAAREALKAWPGGLQVGGGVNEGNAGAWVEAGAGQVIVTSHLFPSGHFSQERLTSLLAALDNDKSKLVIDLSCRKKGDSWFVATDKWQTITDFEITEENLTTLAAHCSEFLIHAADVEGLQTGIDESLVSALGSWRGSPSSPAGFKIPITYAGGGRSLSDLDRVKELSQGRVDLTLGSCLDCFGGGVSFEECVGWNRREEGLQAESNRS